MDNVPLWDLKHHKHVTYYKTCAVYSPTPFFFGRGGGLRLVAVCRNSNRDMYRVCIYRPKLLTPNIPASCMKPPEILFDLHSRKNSESNPHILKDDFRKIQSRYKNYQQIYTDGSKEDSKVGCAVISDNHNNMQRIPDDSSIKFHQYLHWKNGPRHLVVIFKPIKIV